MDEQRARLIIEVKAGVIPEQPDEEYTKRFVITETEWAKARESDKSDAELMLIAERSGAAAGYAALLQNPSANNWVRTDWIWL